MSVPIVAFRPHFPWTVAIATTNGDLIIRQLPTSRHRLSNENIIFLGRGRETMFSSLRWSKSGNQLVADDFIFTFKHNEECTFVSLDQLCQPRCNNRVVTVTVNDADILETKTARTLSLNKVPETKEKVTALCAAAAASSFSFPASYIERMAELLLFMEFNSVHNLY